MHIDERILEFVRDFRLILFVYTIGLQVGPRFFSSLRRQGLKLNILAAAIVILGEIIAAGFRGLFGFAMPAVDGIFFRRHNQNTKSGGRAGSAAGVPGSDFG